MLSLLKNIVTLSLENIFFEKGELIESDTIRGAGDIVSIESINPDSIKEAVSN